MASWSVAPGAIKFDDVEALTPPASAATEVQEQFKQAALLAAALRASKVIGEGSTYTVALSGTANPGHPTGDSVTITVTNSN
jgi:hypothetical protein